MAAVVVLAAPTLHAPDDPGSRGLWGLIALVLLIGLVAAHLRVLRAISRAEPARRVEGSRPTGSTPEVESAPQEAAPRAAAGAVPADRPQAGPRDQAPDLARW